jgi:hypothetical protein
MMAKGNGDSPEQREQRKKNERQEQAEQRVPDKNLNGPNRPSI